MEFQKVLSEDKDYLKNLLWESLRSILQADSLSIQATLVPVHKLLRHIKFKAVVFDSPSAYPVLMMRQHGGRNDLLIQSRTLQGNAQPFIAPALKEGQPDRKRFKKNIHFHSDDRR